MKQLDHASCPEVTELHSVCVCARVFSCVPAKPHIMRLYYTFEDDLLPA